MKTCKCCNADYDDNMKFCPECGSKLEVKQNLCPACGTVYRDGQKFCAECGTKILDSGHAYMSNVEIEELYEEGSVYFDEGDYEKAIQYFQKAAEAGHVDSMYYMGECYFYNDDENEESDKMAVTWYTKAAEAGSAEAQEELGDRYFSGSGVEKDEVKGIEYYIKSGAYEKIEVRLKDQYSEDFISEFKELKSKAESGDVESKFLFGEFLLKHQLVNCALKLSKEILNGGNKDALELLVSCYEKDYEYKYGIFQKDPEAVKWLDVAYRNGNAQAAFLLGYVYYKGLGLDADKAKAVEWFNRSAKLGHSKGKGCARIAEWEIKNNKDYLFSYEGAYVVCEGVKDVGGQDYKHAKIIYIPSSVTTIQSKAFFSCYILETIICECPQNISVESMEYMFSFCDRLNDISFLREWDVSKVVSMYFAFSYCKRLQDISPMEKWDVSSVIKMSFMFNQCESLKDISALANWNVVKVTNTAYMFQGCISLTNISAMRSWSRFATNQGNKRYDVYGMFNGCTAIKDRSPLRSWGITDEQIGNHLFYDKLNRQMSQVRYATPETKQKVSSPETKSDTASTGTSTSPQSAISENEAIDRCIPHVFFIKVLGFDITSPSGKCIHMTCGQSDCKISSWSGTGFLLSDGRFVTARHVVEGWAFPYEGSQLKEEMAQLNVIANNGGKVVAKFIAMSSNGTQIQFTSSQCVINRKNDTVKFTQNGTKLVIASIDHTDYAYFNSGRTAGLSHNNEASKVLRRGTKLVVLGFPLGIGANAVDDINPIYGSGIVAVNGLQNGVILTTDTNYEQGNSGGPVFRADSNGNLEVIGLVSAGAGRTMGFIVPIASVV